MALKFGRNGESPSLNANPHTGRPQPKFTSTGAATLVAGTLPKRARQGSVINPEWRKVFESLGAPKYAFRVSDESKADVKPVSADTGEELKIHATPTQDGPEFRFYNVRNEEIQDVLFVTADGDQYTADGVEPTETLCNIAVTDTPSGLNKLYNAMQKFNKETGKLLRMLSDGNIYDEAGGIKEQRKIIWRMS